MCVSCCYLWFYEKRNEEDVNASSRILRKEAGAAFRPIQRRLTIQERKMAGDTKKSFGLKEDFMYCMVVFDVTSHHSTDRSQYLQVYIPMY